MHRAPVRRSVWLLLAVGCTTTGDTSSNARITARLDSLINLADSTYRQDHRVARGMYEAVLAEATTAGDSDFVARALTGIGMTARIDGDWAEARRIGEQALAIKERRRMGPGDLFRSQNALGLLAWNTGRLSEAVRLLDLAGESARRSNDSRALGMVTVNVGLVAKDQGAFAQARAAFLRGADIARAGGDSVTYGRALNNLAMLDIAMGDPIAAIASIEESRRLARLTGDATSEVNARGQLANAYISLGDPGRAFALLDSALDMAQGGGRRLEVAEDLLLIGDMFSEAGDYRHALDYYARARLATDSLEQPEERGNILRSEAGAHAALSSLTLARQSATEALRVHRGAGLLHAELGDLLQLADLAQREGQASGAEAHLRAAARLADSLGAPIAGVMVGLTRARVAAAARQWPGVLAAIEDVQATVRLAGSSMEAEAYALRARALDALGRREAALEAGRIAIAAVERIRDSYAGDELRSSYTTARADIFAQQVLLLLRSGRTTEALEVADLARGRALLEHLAQARSELRGVTGARDLVEQEALLRRIDALLAQLQERERISPSERSPDDRSATDLRDSVDAMRAEYTALVARSAMSVSDRGTVAGVARPSVEEIRRSLRPGEVLLEYLITTDEVLVFVVTSSGVVTRTLPERSALLTSRVQLARRLLRVPGTDSEAVPILSALHDILIGPVVQAGFLRGVNRIIVVPHGVLTYLPFGALVDSGSYLAERFEFIHLPTSAALPALRASPRALSRQHAAVFAPIPNSLPATQREAQVVSNTLGAELHLREEATEARFRSALQRGGIVHIATHASLNSRNPLFSYIELASTRRRPATDNGQLAAHELLGLRIDASLVFLSGCETGIGGAWSTRFDNGEDYAALAQTLLYAGARNVVATLWRIDDVGAAEFARHFYEGLRGDAYAEALARAQRQLIKDPRYRSPYYWAAYQASGGSN